MIIHEADYLCLTQIFPYFYYRRAIERKFNVRISFQSKNDFLASPDKFANDAAIVLLQSWYTTTEIILNNLFSTIKTLSPNAKIVFLDAMSPADLRLASALSDRVDIYVKKHVLRDRSVYGKPTRGDTNLTDYYMKEYGISAPEVTHKIPASFISKIVVGPSFFTAPRIFGQFKFNSNANNETKTIDVHGRSSYKTDDWYGVMRKEAKAALDSIEGLVCVSEPNVSTQQYFSEIKSSKICFSPFGHGEGCHRDYEAVFGGALLFKPDMSHIETYPDIFVPYKTYVPLSWHFGDLEEKARHFVSDVGERRKIVDGAYSVLNKYCSSDGFLDQMRPVFEL